MDDVSPLRRMLQPVTHSDLLPAVAQRLALLPPLALEVGTVDTVAIGQPAHLDG